MTARFIDSLTETGIHLWLDDGVLRYRCKAGTLDEGVRTELKKRKNAILDHLRAKAGYALSPLQQAYWLGETQTYSLRTPAFVHLGFRAPPVDVERLKLALDLVQERHPTLGMRVDGTGRQAFACPPPPIPVTVADIGTGHADDSVRAFAEGAARLLPDLSAGPPLALHLQHLGHEDVLHFVLRLIAFDSTAVGILLSDLAAAYQDLDGCARRWRAQPLPYDEQFRALETPSPRYRRAEAYWAERVDRLPPPPRLRQQQGDARGTGSRRRSGRLAAGAWAGLSERARRRGLSVNAVLATVFADVLRRWSEAPDFTLNVMFSNRQFGAPYRSDLVTNFSNTLLLDCAGATGSFSQRAAATQRRLYEAMDHSAFGGVEVIRKLPRGDRDPDQPAMPVVFSTLLGGPRPDGPQPADLGWTPAVDSMRTPQVWLDHQVWEDRGELAFNWDTVTGIYPEDMLDEAFTSYQTHLGSLAAEDDYWDAASPAPLAETHLAARRAANATAKAFTPFTLHEGLWRTAATDPEQPALIGPDSRYSYAEAAACAENLAVALITAGIQPGDRVLVHGPKLPETAIALHAVMAAGAAYVPVSHRTPLDRLAFLVADSGARAVITGCPLASERLREGPAIVVDPRAMHIDRGATPVSLPVVNADSLAYVIYTSGSTGQPKGVMITHRAAANTIADVAQRFGIGRNDRLLAISALTFDLSVFDLFGAAALGIPVVFPEDLAVPDPAAWLKAAHDHGVTVWNSVPAIIEMAMDWLGGGGRAVPDTLRVFMASGDWVPLSLPDRVRHLLPRATFWSLGGATEAAIWSNYFRVDAVAPHWRSIPYGFPLANQRFHVLDGDGRPCPTLVAGELYIAGDGLALGYLNAPERSAAAFFDVSAIGERVYRTGDMGCYLPDGSIEFLGRRDFQVKIGGHRIELGEIQKVIEDHPGIAAAAIVVLHADDARRRQLGAVVVPEAGAALNLESVMERARAMLPAYMVPARMVAAERLPLSENGKVDRSRLPGLFAPPPLQQIADPPDGPLETALAGLWERCLGCPPTAATDNFFDLGGNSLLAVQLLNDIRTRFGTDLSLGQVFAAGTLRAMAALLATAEAPAQPMVQLSGTTEAGAPTLYLVHPVGGSCLCYRGLTDILGPSVRLVGLGADEDGDALPLAVMAERYCAAIERSGLAEPVHLGGWSMGGVLALAMAERLSRKGHRIGLVLTIDSWVRESDSPPAFDEATAATAFFLDLFPASGIKAAGGFTETLALARAAGLVPPAVKDGQLRRRFDLFLRNYRALLSHPDLPTLPFLAIDAGRRHRHFPGLRPLVTCAPPGTAETIHVDEDHYSVIEGASAHRIGQLLRQRLAGDCGGASPAPSLPTSPEGFRP